MTKIIVLKPEDVKPRQDLIGQWLDENHYHTLIEEDCDLYLPADCSSDFDVEETCINQMNCSSCHKGLTEDNIVFKFRKNFFSKEEADAAYAGLRDAAVETQNRGIAGGPRTGTCAGREWVTDEQFELLEFFAYHNTKSIFDDSSVKDDVQNIRNKFKGLKCDESRGVVWLSEKIKQNNFKFNTFIDSLCELSIEEAKLKSKDILDNYISKTTYANVVNSGIAGWYDRYPRINWGRPTTYTRDNKEKFEKSYPFLRSLAKAFQELLPRRYSNQLKAANSIDQKFVVPGTPFTTITVNKNFRTAAHVDPANMEDGFANLCVMSNNDKFSGGYLVFPDIGYAVNVRPRDLLLVGNQQGVHGNTELVLEDPLAERLSIIAFFHEGMLRLGSYEYEDSRRQFIDSRRLNKEHPEWRERWNGISPGCFSDNKENDPSLAKEWYDWLKSQPKGDEWLDKYHPWLKSYYESSGIEDFF
jgi:hypothetical protein